MLLAISMVLSSIFPLMTVSADVSEGESNSIMKGCKE